MRTQSDAARIAKAGFLPGADIDHASRIRQVPGQLAAARRDPRARWLLIWGTRCLVRHGAAARLPLGELGDLQPATQDAVFLGLEDGAPRFALPLQSDPGEMVGGHFAGLRELLGLLSDRDAALLAYARAMVHWLQQHRYCAACGAANRPNEGGFVLECSSASCGHRHFPRLDPAIIVLVHDGERCLLGRQASWPDGRFSTIAGFVEPGETLEDAVHREVAEETNIRIGECRYMASQPWPFPSSLMIGFHARASSSGIRLNDGELAEARWFNRSQLQDGRVLLPPSTSIAWQLIRSWFDLQGGHGPLPPGRPFAARHDDPAGEH